MPQIGDRIAGRYELQEIIGEGGMGQVFRAVQHPVGRNVALKVLLGEFVEDNVKQARFLREAQILANLKSAHTVSLIDFGVLDDGVVFIAMEYLEGGTLRDLIDRGSLPVRTAYIVAQQILKSIAEAHGQGIIHRDLKPGNVLIDHIDGEKIVVRVADFGIAKWQSPETSLESTQTPELGLMPTASVKAELVQTAPGMRLGTPEYIPPEQAFAKPIDHTVDLYAFGVIFYEMLVGRKPFSAENAQGMYLAHLYEAPKPVLSVVPHLEISQKVDDLIMSLMQKLPENRPQSAKSVLKLLNRVVHEAPLNEQTFTEMPALNPHFESAELDEDEVVTPRSSVNLILLVVGSVLAGLGLGALLF